MARVVLLAQACAPVVGGVESHVEDLLRGLGERNHDVLIVCGRGGKAAADQRRWAITSAAVAGADLFSDCPLDHTALHERIAEIRREFDPDVIHVHNPNHFHPVLADAVLDNGASCRRVASVHDRPSEPRHNETLTRAWDHVLFASEYLKAALPRPAVSSVLHLGIDTDAFRPGVVPHPALASLDRPLVFHPARLLSWKGILDSAAAFIEVRRTAGSGTLLLAASSDILSSYARVRTMRSAVLRLFCDAGIPEAVVFRDFTRSEMPAAYAASSMVWYPTRDDEPFGLVPLEAMACGRPVVVTASGGMRETVVDGDGGVVIAPGDVRALASETVALLHAPARLAEMSTKGVRHAAGWSLAAYLERLEQIYVGDT